MQPAGVSVITVWTCCNFLPHLNRGTLRSFLGKLNVCPWRGNEMILVSVELLWDKASVCLYVAVGCYTIIKLISWAENKIISFHLRHCMQAFSSWWGRCGSLKGETMWMIWRALFQNAINAKFKKMSLSCHFAAYWTYSLLHQCFMPNHYISLFKMYCKMQVFSKPL